MKRTGRPILLAASAAIVVTTLYPLINSRLPNGGIVGLGFGFLFGSPLLPLGPHRRFTPLRNPNLVGSLEVVLLLAGWLAIVLAAGEERWGA